MAKTIIFDMGGVLVNLDWDKVCARLQELSGLSVGDVRREVINGPIVRSAMRGLLSPRAYHEALCEKLDVSLAYEEFVDVWNGLLSPNEAMVPVVEQLKPGHSLVLASNTDAIHFAHAVERFPVLKSFERYFLSYEMGLLKPDPGFFRHVLGALETPAANCIFIDDRADNVESARGIGITAIQFERVRQLQRDLSAVL